MGAALADLILVVHFLIAASVAAGFVLIPLGARLGWAWIHNRRLRLLHMAAIACVALESLAGIACPLTVWEDALRGAPAEQRGFVERWVGTVLYWELPPEVFVGVYVTATLLAVALWRWVPPRR